MANPDETPGQRRRREMIEAMAKAKTLPPRRAQPPKTRRRPPMAQIAIRTRPNPRSKVAAQLAREASRGRARALLEVDRRKARRKQEP